MIKSSDSKRQFLNSLENLKSELLNVQRKIVNLKILEKNLIVAIKRQQKNFKLSFKSKTEVQKKLQESCFFFSEESTLDSIVDLLGYSEDLLVEPRELSDSDWR